jgi:hypothetical protein
LLARSDFDAPLIEGDVLIGLLEVVIGQDETAFEHQGSLDYTSDT